MSTVVEQSRPPRRKQWTKQEYLDLVERGAFDKQRVYLFRGDIIEMAPHGHPHAFAIMKLSRYLMNAFPAPNEVRVQLSFITPGDSVPEPDAVVCTANDARHKPHPVRAELVVEVAASSLAEDRELAAEYAAAGVPEYWIVDTERRCVEVLRNPLEDPASRLGYRYAQTRTFASTDRRAPLKRPDVALAIETLFPE